MKLSILAMLFLSTVAFANPVKEFELENRVKCRSLISQDAGVYYAAYYKCGSVDLNGDYVVFYYKTKKKEVIKTKFCANGMDPEFRDKLLGPKYRCLKAN